MFLIRANSGLSDARCKDLGGRERYLSGHYISGGVYFLAHLRSLIADLRRRAYAGLSTKAEPPSNSPFSSERWSGRGCKQGTRACSQVAFSSESLRAFPAASSLGKSRPARGSSGERKKDALSSALAYKFICELSQFKCPRCFNRGPSPPARSLARSLAPTRMYKQPSH